MSNKILHVINRLLRVIAAIRIIPISFLLGISIVIFPIYWIITGQNLIPILKYGFISKYKNFIW